MGKLLLLIFGMAVGFDASNSVEGGNIETDTVVESTEEVVDTFHIITTRSITSAQDTYSLSKHLEFFTSNYRYFTEKYTPPETSDSTYKMRLDSLGKGMAVPLVYNPKVKNYIKAYTDSKRKQVNIMLSLGQYYFPLFEEMFARYEIPSELKYLAIIESALNPRATSRVGASGLWQFMYQTGQMYNLKVNPFVDERFDPVKATEAAARYLKDLYRSFGDWTLVIAAYNCGPGNVNKAIRKTGGKTDFWKIYQFLPKETRNYVPAYIGATYAMNYYAEHDIPAPANDFPMLTDTVVVDVDMDFNIIAQTLELPLQTLRDLNPQYKQDIIPGGSHYYSMRLPVYIIPRYLEMKDTMAGQFEEVSREIVLSYRIKQHETLSGIAVRFDVSVKDLITWNKLKSTTIYPNQILQIHTTQRSIEAIRARPKVKRDEEQTVQRVAETLLASTITKPKPTSSRHNVASQAVAVTASDSRSGSASANRSVSNVATSSTANSSINASVGRSASNAATSSMASGSTNASVGRSVSNVATSSMASGSTNASANAGIGKQTVGQSRLAAQNPTMRQQSQVPAAKRGTATAAQQQPQRTQQTAQRQRVIATQAQQAGQQAAKPNSVRLPKGTVVSYIVKRGDTLYAIYHRYRGSNMQEIIRMNNLANSGNLIKVGQILKIRIN
jgi:membrane-bound lytic murein transglycosylase D